MTTKVGVVALLTVGIVLMVWRGEDVIGPTSTAPNQTEWPVPGLEARAQYGLVLVTTEPVVLGDMTLHGAVCRTFMTVDVAEGKNGLDLIRTQGRVGGSIEIEPKDGPRERRPFSGSPDLHAVVFGEGGAMGRTVSRRVAGEATREGEASAAWTVLGVVPPPPAESEIAVGLSWTADAAWPLFPGRTQPARFVIEAVEAGTIRVRATWAGGDLTSGWSAPDADLVVDISRRDGLALEAALTMTFTSTEEAPDVDGVVAVPVRGKLKRLDWTDRPTPGPDVEALAEDLADPDPVRRAKAAKRLGAAWPDAGRVAPALVAARADEDAHVRRCASDALRHLAEQGVPAILAFLDESHDLDRESHEEVLEQIQRLGAKFTPRDIAGAGLVCPPSGAIGLLTLHPFGAEIDVDQEAVWMLAGLATSPALLGPDGYEARNRELGAACAAFVGLAPPPPDARLGPPTGILERLGSPRLGTKVAALAMLARWDVATPEVLDALRGCLGDENRMVARVARFLLRRHGHPVDGETRPSAEDLIGQLERFDEQALGSSRSHRAVELIDGLVTQGGDVTASVEALEALAKRARGVSGEVHERAVAALVQLAGPTPQRRDVLIRRLAARMESADPAPGEWHALLTALSVDADRMEGDQAQEIVRLLKGYEDGKGFLHVHVLRQLALALDARHLGPLESVWIEGLMRVPPHTADLFPAESPWPPSHVIPGTERFHTAVDQGAKVYGMLVLRGDLLAAAGRYGGDDERVRTVLERLVAEGDPWTRTMAARAIRRLDAH